MTSLRPVVVMLILAGLAVGGVALQRAPARPAPPRPAAGAVAAPAATPRYTARDLLATPVALEPAQRRRLERLDTAWDREIEPLDAAIAASRTEFEAFMAEAAQRNGASLAEIQARSADVRELSAQLRERRAAHEAAALELLTPEQRAALPVPRMSVGGVR
jgi:Spy/CpxP family protein refolding chaperone